MSERGRKKKSAKVRARAALTSPAGGDGLAPIPRESIARYGEILEATLVRDYRPHFSRLGFAIDDAWAKACRLRPEIG